MDRRTFLKTGGVVAGTALLSGNVFGRLFAFAAVPGDGPYGPLLPANADGLQLPAGFTSRLIAVSGQNVAGTSQSWHQAPDGGACFPAPGGGWVYVSNSEVGSGGGGARAVMFDAAGNIVSAYSVLSGTNRNCAGGLTATGGWLSCEENGAAGKVYECNPLQPGQGIQRPLLGSFNHEAAFVDPATGIVYLTEDDPAGRFYRFVPSVPGDLSAGQLFAAQNNGGVLSWVTTSSAVPDRQATTTAFNGGEGIWIESGILYFTTKGDRRVWKLELTTQNISVFYDGNNTPGAALNAVDNVTVHAPSGDVYVAEDGGNLELCLIGLVNGQEEVAPFLRFVGHSASEVAGPAFSPDHTRLYVSSQRGTNGSTGRTYEITGPFRTSVAPTTTTSTTTSTTLAATTTTTTAPTTTTTAPTTTTTSTTTTAAPTTTTTAAPTTPTTSTTVPTTTVIPITKDAHVRNGNRAGTNYGNASVMEVRTASGGSNTRWAYVGAVTSTHSGPVSNATLRVWVRNTGSGTNSVAVRAVANTTWNESGLTWNNKPALGATLATFTVTSTTGTWVSIDVTSYVAAERAAGRSTLTFALVEPANGSMVEVSSREATANRPELRIS